MWNAGHLCLQTSTSLDGLQSNETYGPPLKTCALRPRSRTDLASLVLELEHYRNPFVDPSGIRLYGQGHINCLRDNSLILR